MICARIVKKKKLAEKNQNLVLHAGKDKTEVEADSETAKPVPEERSSGSSAKSRHEVAGQRRVWVDKRKTEEKPPKRYEELRPPLKPGCCRS